MTPPPPRPSGSIIRNAKLLVPAGGLIQDNCGETFSPRQFGFRGSFARLLPTFLGIIWPSLKVVDDNSKSFSCALAVPAAHKPAIPPARRRYPMAAFTSLLPEVSLLGAYVAASSRDRLGAREQSAEAGKARQCTD